MPARADGRSRNGTGSITLFLVIIIFAFVLLTASVAAEVIPNTSGQTEKTAPEQVRIGIYVVDINRVDVGAGTVGADFYLHLKSDEPISS